MIMSLQKALLHKARNKIFYFVSCFLFICALFSLKTNAAVLDWDTNTWPAPVGGTPTLSQTYAIGGDNVTVTISGDTSGLVTTGTNTSPQTSTFQTGGLTPAENGLFLRMDFPEGTPPVNAQSITVTYTFLHPDGVNNINFNVFDIDATLNQWLDVVQASVNLVGGGSANPTSITASSANQVDLPLPPAGNSASGTGSAGNTSSAGNVGFTFNQSGIASLVFVYSNNAPNTSGSHNQWAAIHDINFTIPPTVTKQFNPNSITAGGVSTLTINLGNNDISTATLSADLVDNLPAGVTIANPANIGGTCPGTTNAPVGGSAVTYTNGSTIPSGGCTITVDVTSATPGTVTNTIAVNALQTNLGNNATATSDNLTVNFAAPTITKTFSPNPINQGGTSTLTLTLTNLNTIALTGVAVTDTYPAQITNAIPANGATSCGGTVSATDGGGGVSLTSGTIPASGSCTVTVDVTSTTSGAHTNTTGVVSTNEAPNSATANADLNVNDLPTITKAFSTDPIAYGATSTLTITLGNTNASSATLTSPLIDTLPTAGNGDVVVAVTPNIGGTCNTANVTAIAGASTITYASGAIIPSGGCTITVDISSTTPGTHTNTIAVGDLQTTFGNNATVASDDITVNAPVSPSVTKSFSPDPINLNGTSTLTITLGNSNGVPATLSANLVDTLPPNLVVANPANIGGTCTGTTNAPVGGGTITYTSGSTILAGGCTITVEVTSAIAGNYPNTIPVGALQTDLGSNITAASDSLTVNATTPPTVTKSFVPAIITAGGVSQLTITLGNANASVITLTANMDDNLPIGVTATAVNVATTCTAGSVDISLNTRVRYVTGATIPAGGCNIVVNVTSSSLGTVTNTILANALQTTVGNNANPASANLTVNSGGGAPTCPAGSTLINQTGNADSAVGAGPTLNPSNAVGTLQPVGTTPNNGNSARVRFNSTSTLTLAMTDTVPTNGTIVISISRGNNNGNVLIEESIDGSSFSGTQFFNNGPNNSLQRVNYSVASSSGARYLRFTRQGGNVWIDGVEYTQICQPAPTADLSISKDDSNASYTPGGTGTYVLTITNNGPSAVTGAVIQDTFPSGVSLSGSWSCSATAGSNCSAASGGSTNDTSIFLTADIINGGVITVNVPVQYSADHSQY